MNGTRLVAGREKREPARERTRAVPSYACLSAIPRALETRAVARAGKGAVVITGEVRDSPACLTVGCSIDRTGAPGVSGSNTISFLLYPPATKRVSSWV